MKASTNSASASGTMAALLRQVFRLSERLFGQNSASKTAEFIYTILLKPRFAKAIVNRLILHILPRSVFVGGATVVINIRDPVVSGALALGVYEKDEISFIRRACVPGQTVVDVGANVGLYTAIAGLIVGRTGRVIAVEPDPECAQFLEQTVRANNLDHVRIVRAAASNVNGAASLFTRSANRGDNRLYPTDAADGSIEVKSVCLDDYLSGEGVDAVDIVKIDVQGYEGHVIEGFERTIRSSPRLTMLMEFWPEGLTSAGSDPIDLLNRLEALGLTLYELKQDGAVDAVTDKTGLIGQLKGRKYTNLVLFGPQATLINC